MNRDDTASVGRTMKLLYCSDLHGDEVQYQRLNAVAGELCPDAIVLGGDMLPDDSALVPEQMGRMQPHFVTEHFRSAILRLKEASGQAEVLFIFGNHDWGSSVPAMEALAEEGVLSILDHKRPTAVGGVHFLGYPYTPPTSWYVKDFERLDEPGDRPPLLGGARWNSRFSRVGTHGAATLFENEVAIADDLAEMAAPPDPWVFVAHAPPSDCDLDCTYDRMPRGSRAVRHAIERLQPLLSLHGHVHESPRVSERVQECFGKTLAINVGQESAMLHCAEIEIDVAAGAVARFEHRQQS